MIAPMRRSRIVFAGGGTGGHLYPALAVARALPAGEAAFLVPDDRGDAARLGGEFPVRTLACPRPDRGRLLFPARLARSVRRARRVLREWRASAVVGLGGYACVPACLAARTLRLPIYLIECNAVPGRATTLLSRFAAGVGLGTAVAEERLAGRRGVRVTGTPLRHDLQVSAAPSAFGLADGTATLLVVGGSQGARGLNQRVLDALPQCAGLPFQAIHAAGARDAERVRDAYARAGVRAHVADFLPDIGRAYAAADLVLARAGASTVAECTALGRPAVYVPYPWHKDEQQRRNARLAVAVGAARLVEEAALTPAAFRGIVEHVLLAPNERARMAAAAVAAARPEAARAMAAHLLECFGPAVGEAAWTAELGE